MKSRLAHARALATFEIRQQLREPLTALYGLVLLLLMAGFTGSSVVNLVSDRGSVPSTSTWSLWMAVGGLTAFGQVITTMIATTAVLRDDAERTMSLLATTGVDVRVWLLARLVAAFVVLTMVFAAIPVGAWLGGVFGPGAALPVLTRTTVAHLILVVPTMGVVGAAVGVAGALSRRVVVALLASLTLLGLWQLALVLVERPSTMMLAALLDPFGNAPMIIESMTWDAARRSGGEAPMSALLLVNRLVWLGLSGLIVGIGLWRVRWDGPTRTTRPAINEINEINAINAINAKGDEAVHSTWRIAASAATPTRQAARATAARATAVWQTVATFTAQWIFREGAWRAVLGLALANALLNALLDSSLSPPSHAAPTGGIATPLVHISQVLAVVQTHARVFLILMATVYAGEIVWRERDQRTSELMDALPVKTSVLAMGRICGLVWVQSSAALVLATGALLVAIVRLADGAAVMTVSALSVWLAWSLFHVWLPFVLWGIAAIAIHVTVRHKVAAHFLIISGWVGAVILDARGASAWWYRYAEPAPLLEGSGLALETLLMRGGYWSVVGMLLIAYCAAIWPRGAWARDRPRRVTSRR